MQTRNSQTHTEHSQGNCRCPLSLPEQWKYNIYSKRKLTLSSQSLSVFPKMWPPKCWHHYCPSKADDSLPVFVMQLPMQASIHDVSLLLCNCTDCPLVITPPNILSGATISSVLNLGLLHVLPTSRFFNTITCENHYWEILWDGQSAKIGATQYYYRKANCFLGQILNIAASILLRYQSYTWVGSCHYGGMLECTI